MPKSSRRWILAVCALMIAPAGARAAETISPAPSPQAERQREVVLAFGYGSIVAPRGLLSYSVTDTAQRISALDGFSVDVTRRIPMFEYGVRFWTTGGSSDGKGASAHVLTRWTIEARFFPWRFRTLEPWVGGEFGLALADDYAIWNKKDLEPAHKATAGVRPGLDAALEAGGRLRLFPLLSLGLRGGLLFLGFDRAGGAIAESPQASKYLVHPTDYGRKVWFSMAVTAELTVPD